MSIYVLKNSSAESINEEFCVLNFNCQGTDDPSAPIQKGNNKPGLKRSTRKRSMHNKIQVLACDNTVPSRIEQDRLRARASIYSQRARDKSKVTATTLRLTREIQMLHNQISQLDSYLAVIPTPPDGGCDAPREARSTANDTAVPTA